MVETALTDTPAPPAPNGSRPLPDSIRLETAPRFSANQLRQIKAVTGQSLEAILGDSAAVIQAYAYVELRKAGYELTWDEAGDIPLELGEPDADPLSRGIATASPDSADSGA